MSNFTEEPVDVFEKLRREIKDKESRIKWLRDELYKINKENQDLREDYRYRKYAEELANKALGYVCGGNNWEELNQAVKEYYENK